MRFTHPDVMAVDVQLRNQNVIRLHPVADLLLIVDAHEHVTLLEFHEQRAQDLFDVGAFGVRLPDDAHAGRVEHHFAGVLLLVALRKTKDEESYIHVCPNTLLAGKYSIFSV